MKYWIFQNNQVLGPYSTEDLSRLSSFNAESLVCPEGRKGTSMGDWQRAGMVPDLSVSLIQATSRQGVKTPVASLAGLPPEPTLKDLAVLGSLQEKMAMLEDVVLQLQEGLRVKDAELASLQSELAGKSIESTEIRKDAESLHRETEMRRREAEVLKAETEEFKKRIAELEERVAAVNALSETIGKTAEAEKNVEHDVEAHGSTIGALSQEIEALRSQLRERLDAPSRAEAPSIPAEHSPAAALSAPPPSPEFSAPAPAPLTEGPSASGPIAPAAEAPLPDIAPDPAFPVNAPLPSFDATLPVPPSAAEPAAPAPDVNVAPSGMVSFDPLSSPAESVPAPEPAGVVDVAASAPPPPKKKKALLLGGILGLAALAGLAFFSGKVPGMNKRTPAPDLSTPAPMPAPVEPPPTPEPAPDERQTAIDFAKQWTMKSGGTLGQALETLSPANGNLSPWMAEPLSSGRVQVNYFARGSAPGSPTVAYEFEVDLTAHSVVGRNAAAKSVIAGKAAPPPAPKKPKAVKVKAKPAAPAQPMQEESLDSLLGAPGSAPAAQPTEPAVKPEDPEPEAAPKPVKNTHAKRAAKAAPKAAQEGDGKAEDASLLDDLLKE